VGNGSTPLEYFTYSIVGDEAIITGYNGPDTEVIVPSTIEGYSVVVGTRTFPSDSVVTKVTLGDGVRVVQDGFELCPVLTTLVMGDNVIIEDDGVCACYGLTRIEMGSNVTLDGGYALCAQANFVSFYTTYGPGVYTGSGSSWTFQD
jgi:hypothetical protein